MKDFLKKELYSLRAVTAILARWLLLAVPTGLVCGAVAGRAELAAALPAAGGPCHRGPL